MADPADFTPVTDNALLPFGGLMIPRGYGNHSDPLDISGVFEDGFSFGSQTFDTITIATNGGITLGDGGSDYYYSIDYPNPVYDENVISPFLSDLMTSNEPAPEGSGVFFDLNTERDSVVVTWNQVESYNFYDYDTGAYDSLTFQLEIIDLGEGDSEIVFRYQDMAETSGDYYDYYNYTLGAHSDLAPRVAFTGTSYSTDFYRPSELVTAAGNTGTAGVWQFRVIDGLMQADDVTGNNETGTDGDDLLEGTFLPDQLDGLGGNDTINGGAGDDTLSGGDGNDQINTGAGLDQATGGAGDDVIVSGQTGDDYYYGYGDEKGVNFDGMAGNDTLTGGTGNDTLSGGDGNDEINTGRGRDQVFGGAGDDLIVSGTADEFYDYYYYYGYGTTSFDGMEGNDTIRGGSSTDLIGGQTGNDMIWGGGGADNLNGGEGDDVIAGGFGNDFIRGGDGDDFLFGGVGPDTVEGGAGADRFYVSNDGSDSLHIMDYNLSEGDILILDGDTYSRDDIALQRVATRTADGEWMNSEFSVIRYVDGFEGERIQQEIFTFENAAELTEIVLRLPPTDGTAADVLTFDLLA